MNVLVLSDIHGSADCLQTALDSPAGSADVIVLCGDYLNHGPRNPLPDGWDTKRTGELLNAEKRRIIAVRGNCDSEVDQMVLSFPCLNAYTTLFFKPGRELNGRIFVHHGHLYARDQLKELLPPGTLVISGHTHVTVLEEDGGLFYFNPGSVSLPKCGDGKTCGLITVGESGVVERVSLLTLHGQEIRSRTFS